MKAQVSIRFELRNALGNRQTLDATTDRFGVLRYRLYGTLTRVPLCLSNLGCKRTFPPTVDGHKDVDALVNAIKGVLASGYRHTAEVLFAKELPECCPHCGGRLDRE